MRLIDADRLTRPEIIKMYYYLPNGDVAIPIIDIEHAPTVDAAPVKHGRWMTYKYDEKQYRHVIIPWDGKGLPHDIFCSKCRTPALLNGHEEDVDSNYCPKCGAKMAGNDE